MHYLIITYYTKVNYRKISNITNIFLNTNQPTESPFQATVFALKSPRVC